MSSVAKIRHFIKKQPSIVRYSAVVKSHLELHKRISDMPLSNIRRVADFLSDHSVVALISERDDARRLPWVGVTALWSDHGLPQDLQRAIHYAELLTLKKDELVADQLDIIDKIKKFVLVAAKTYAFVVKADSGILKKSEIDLAGFLKDAIDDFTLLLTDMYARPVFNLVTTEEKISARINVESFGWALFNIAQNSYNYGALRVDIKLKVISKNQLQIEIIDDGSGFGLDSKEDLLTPGYSTSGKSGRGFGRSRAREIVEMHEGTLDIDSPSRFDWEIADDEESGVRWRRGCVVRIVLGKVTKSCIGGI